MVPLHDFFENEVEVEDLFGGRECERFSMKVRDSRVRFVYVFFFPPRFKL